MGKPRIVIASIEQLFTLRRSPEVLWKRILLYIYSPIGFILLLLRILLGFHVFIVACILRKSMMLRCAVLRSMCTLLGIVVVEEGKRDRRCSPLIVSNHVSALDHMAVDLIDPCILPSVWDIPNLLRWCLGYADFGVRQGRQVLINQACAFCRRGEMSLLTLPEAAMTNGQRGMLKFSSWAFDVCESVQPLIISLWRPPIADVASSVLGGSWWQDTLWFLFVPFTIFHLEWLPIVKRSENESAEEFCSRVVQMMADASDLCATSYTSQDAVDAAKRHLKELQRKYKLARTPRPSVRDVSSADLDAMAMRVKETFPSVTLHAIRQDLDQTRSVDVTSNNILEGSVIEEKADCSIKPFAKSSTWQRTFNQRKWTLIEENRKKYMNRKNISL